MDARPTTDTRPRVHVVDSADTSAASDDIIRGLEELGVDASVGPPSGDEQVRAVVVLLSPGALRDPVWNRRVDALRSERLVPVRVSEVADNEVPQFLRELNWVFYRPDDAKFLAQLFTGINTDASRFRDARDTRALAERWEGSGRSPDLLLDDRREILRRIRTAADSADTADPLAPRDQLAGLGSKAADRLRALANKADPPVAFLASSSLAVRQTRRRRSRRIAFRSVIAAVTVAAIVFTVVFVQQETKKSTNAVSFAIGNSANDGRPDLAAIKAGASLVDSKSYPGDDGRLRIATNALSQHWPLGYLTSGGYALQSARFLGDGSIEANDDLGALLKWRPDLVTHTTTKTAVTVQSYFDVDPTGELAVLANSAGVSIIRHGATSSPVTGISGLDGVSLAPADDRALVTTATEVWAIEGIGSTPKKPVRLGSFTSVEESIQTTSGHAVALVLDNSTLALVDDKGNKTVVGNTPGPISAATVAPDGKSFALDIDDSIWTYTGGEIEPSGIVIPGVEMAMSMTSDGLVLVSDRTRGSWLADPALGLNLGPICNAFADTDAFSLERGGNRVLCISATTIAIDSVAQLRPAAIGVAARKPVLNLSTTGALKSLSIVDGFVRLDRADGKTFAFDSASLSMTSPFERPASIAKVDFFATGALLGADNIPTTLAVTANGQTFAIGFDNGRLLEVDIDKKGLMAPVGSWQLPDHASVQSISWAGENATIAATTSAGNKWVRPSCSGCWSSHTLTAHIASRVWLCYEAEDIDAMGDTSRTAFALRACATKPSNS